jgi:Fe-S cluster assembly protein SufD
MIELLEEKENYLADFEDFGRHVKAQPDWLTAIREKGLARFDHLGFPTTHDEEWRFTNLAALTKIPFRHARAGAKSAEQALLSHSLMPLDHGYRLVFVNGRYMPALSSRGPLPEGLLLTRLSDWKTAGDRAEPHLARYAGYEDHPFVALNTAFISDGALVQVAPGTVIDEPVHLLFVSTADGEPTVAYPRNLVVVGRGAQLTLVETYLGADGDVYFTNAVTEVLAAENAVVDHYKLQQESRDAFHIATLQVQQNRGSNFASHLISLGGSLVRSEVNAVLDAEGCECILNGLYQADLDQHMDNRTVIDHAKPHCNSHELYKGVLDGRAHGVFNGKIFVRQDAQKTDAKQTNQTLLLSEDATINTKPQLEIYADDVKCTHGATVGQLDDNALFYLRSRGIGIEEARGVLTFAFANDIIGRVKVRPLRVRLEESFLAAQHLPEDTTAKEPR